YLGVIYGGGNEGIIHYKSDDGSGPDGTYTPVDTVWKSIWAGSSLDWDNNGLLWVGSYYDGNKGWKAWYAMDTTQNMVIVDTVGHCAGDTWETGVPAGGTYWSPRGAAWSADGKTMYTTDYDGGVIKKWTNAAPVGPGSPEITAGIDYEGETPVIVVNFTLSQNYPNPFNPTTTIEYSIPYKAKVTLKVFDIQGREVVTLVDKNEAAGKHTVNFDASKFATGIYFYQLTTSDNQALVKKMMFIK
ncbi:T9SS type A sorting domain-containing protein, partial [bacterium]|nr:T9SS type A sorting domain-containing protein [bacterium]